MSQPVQVGQRRNPDATIYVGDLDPQVDEEVLWELFLQVGPVAYTHIPKVSVPPQRVRGDALMNVCGCVGRRWQQ